MLILPVWGLSWQMFHPQYGWWVQGNFLLLAIGIVVLSVQIWIVAEGLMIWRRARGVLEEALPPLAVATRPSGVGQAVSSGGRSC
jgi:carbon starvation protein